MIHLFFGDDTKNKFINYEKFIKSLPEDVEIFSFSRNDFDQTQIESFYSGSGLFFSKSALIFPSLLEKEEVREFILEKLDLMATSQNYFIFLESRLNKPMVDAFKKAIIKEKGEINIFELPKAKKEKFDNFLLANAFANKDKLNMWIYFRQAMDLGVGMEELIGVLFWKIKDMTLKKNFYKYSQAKLKNTANKLSYLLPEARREGKDAEVVFEEFLLEVV